MGKVQTALKRYDILNHLNMSFYGNLKSLLGPQQPQNLAETTLNFLSKADAYGAPNTDTNTDRQFMKVQDALRGN